MSNIVKLDSHKLNLTRSQIELLKATVCKGATDDEFAFFLAVAQRAGLDPFARQIHAVKRWDTTLGRESMAIQTGIDGYRLIAERSGKYLGQTRAQWCGADAKWLDVWLLPEPPSAAQIGIYRDGAPEPIYGLAHYTSYVQRKKDGSPAALWRTMPAEMLIKCAEALAIRKAFPNETSGVLTDDEMAQAEETSRAAPRIQMPQRKTEPKLVSVPAQATSENQIWTGCIENITTKRGKNQSDGREWTLYIIHGAGDATFGTFSETVREAAQAFEGTGEPVSIAWEPTLKGGKSALAIAATDEPPREPGEGE